MFGVTAEEAMNSGMAAATDEAAFTAEWNAPAIPQAPTFKGSTKLERRVFMREYQKYLAQINALQCNGSRPFVMPVGTCMDPFSKRWIAMFDLNKDHNLVSEAERVQSWSYAGGDLMRVLEQDHQELVLHQEGKVVVEAMARAETLKIAPAPAISADFQLYVGLKEAPVAPQTANAVGESGIRGRRSDDGSRSDGCHDGGARNALKAQPVEKPDASGDKHEAAQGMLEAAPGEAQLLVDALVNKQRGQINVLAAKSNRRVTKGVALVEDSVRVENLLLDSGADVNAISCGVMEALTAAAVAVDIVAWVDDTASSFDLIISRPVMEMLGFSVDDLLVEARQQKSEWDVSDGVGIPYSNMAHSDGIQCATPDVMNSKIVEDNKATCGMRRYPPAYVEYMRERVEALEAKGMVYKNNRSKWASALRIVPKEAAGALRMTIDSRPINACTDPMLWSMPNLDSALASLEGTSDYFNLNWTKGYWLLPLHSDSQEYFSFMTPFGINTPTRVLMGQTDAEAYCQSVVRQMFDDLLFRGLLVW
ncbi:hypothetical protein H310_14269 [Aphanomyces invadans]|uniref:Peptidase A2 domain-containing protein n=1 Tax=Aphanomyces invadans TaxID=157072 RepID=A0A024TAK7_9STRA|nr:hypothetical protein H310_14269 [Aphanomyces invadans]ETV91029.1 hypothetical protein H310_14269 [Aphanomyces invadans]|eukprot:XP_008880309.1 hypothetical protein H310_14269 [Aphanomyces invadans]